MNANRTDNRRQLLLPFYVDGRQIGFCHFIQGFVILPRD